MVATKIASEEEAFEKHNQTMRMLFQFLMCDNGIQQETIMELNNLPTAITALKRIQRDFLCIVEDKDTLLLYLMEAWESLSVCCRLRQRNFHNLLKESHAVGLDCNSNDDTNKHSPENIDRQKRLLEKWELASEESASSMAGYYRIQLCIRKRSIQKRQRATVVVREINKVDTGSEPRILPSAAA